MRPINPAAPLDVEDDALAAEIRDSRLALAASYDPAVRATLLVHLSDLYAERRRRLRQRWDAAHLRDVRSILITEGEQA